MTKQSKNQILGEIENHQPKWLKWTSIKKKYPNKWVMLGYKEKGNLEDVKLDILKVADTREEVSKYNTNYIDYHILARQYVAFSIRKTTNPQKKRKIAIISHSRTLKN